MHTDAKNRRSFLALLFAAGDLRRCTAQKEKMLRYAFYIFLLLLMVFPNLCLAERIDVSTSTEGGLVVQAHIDPKFEKISKKDSKILGEIHIKNTATTPQKFGNSYLFLKVNGKFVARTYKDSIASEMIDFSEVEIPASESISIPVYWVFSVPDTVVIDELSLLYNNK
jgi:hypothetical protein